MGNEEADDEALYGNFLLVSVNYIIIFVFIINEIINKRIIINIYLTILAFC